MESKIRWSGSAFAISPASLLLLLCLALLCDYVHFKAHHPVANLRQQRFLCDIWLMY